MVFGTHSGYIREYKGFGWEDFVFNSSDLSENSEIIMSWVFFILTRYDNENKPFIWFDI